MGDRPPTRRRYNIIQTKTDGICRPFLAGRHTGRPLLTTYYLLLNTRLAVTRPLDLWSSALLLKLKGTGIKLIILALFRNQVLVSASLNNNTLFKHHNHVRIHNR